VVVRPVEGCFITCCTNYFNWSDECYELRRGKALRTLSVPRMRPNSKKAVDSFLRVWIMATNKTRRLVNRSLTIWIFNI
jgi:hypothetical protein